jgi:hypothetical protein
MDMEINKVRTTTIRYIFFLCLLLVVLAVRTIYGLSVPLSGDECGVSMQQAVGKWEDYSREMSAPALKTRSELIWHVNFDPNHSLFSVLEIMRNDKIHAPLYFVLLHYQIRFFGISELSVRGLSVIFSVLALLAMFLLIREIFGFKSGLVAAVLMSLSPYFLEFGPMVRPYPLMTFLTLISTWLLIMIVRKGYFNFRSPLTYFYILSAVSGLYGFYSFIFILISHLVFLFVVKWKRDFKDLIKITIVYGVIILMLLPWITSAFQGVSESQVKDQYFKGEYSLSFFITKFLVNQLFPGIVQFFTSETLLTTFLLVIAAILAFIFIKAIVQTRFVPFALPLFLSLFSYFLLNLLTDKILVTRSLVIDKHQYYLASSFVILLTIGFIQLFKGKTAGTISVLLIIGVMATGFIYKFTHPVGYDGPVSFDRISKSLREVSSDIPDDKVLIVYNTSKRRFLLPLAYALKKDVSYLILWDDGKESVINRLDFKDYQLVCLVNTYIPEWKIQKLKWKNIDTDDLGRMLSSAGFSLIQSDGPFDQVNTTRIISYRSD